MVNLKKIQTTLVSHIELGTPANNTGGGVTVLLKEIHADFICDQDTAFLLEAYFLKQFSVIDDENEIGSCIRVTPETLPPGLSRNQFETVVKRFQRLIASDSCSFVLGLLNDMSEFAALKTVAGDFLKRDEMEREVIPAFLSGHIIFRHLLANDYPASLLLFIRKDGKTINKFHFPMKANKKRDDFELGLEPDLDSPCLIFKGEMYGDQDKQAVLKNLKSYGVLRVLEAFMAAHCQYSGNQLKHFNDIMEQLSMKHSKGYPSVELLCQRYDDWLWLGKKIIAKELDAFLLRHIFSGLLSKTI